MPFFKIETNHQMSASDTEALLAKSSKLISELLGKPEPYVMVSIETGRQMMFGGNVESTAFVQLKSIGLPIDQCAVSITHQCAC